MLADFFLHKRGDIKKGNKLVRDLEETLGAIKSDQDGGSLAGEAGEHSLAHQYQAAAVGKDEAPVLEHFKLAELMHLDVALNNHLHNDKSALSNANKALPDEPVMIP